MHAGRPAWRPRPDAPGRRWHSAIYKDPVTGPVMLRTGNLDGDGQANSANHGGPERAVLVYGAGHYAAWAAELGRELAAGSFGENLTVEGFDEATACIGDVYGVGGAAIQLSEVRGPCYKLQYRTGVPDLIERVLATGRSGVYARVLKEGLVEAGDEVTLCERPHPAWTARRAYLVMDARRTDAGAAAELGSLEHLSSNWRRLLTTAD